MIYLPKKPSPIVFFQKDWSLQIPNRRYGNAGDYTADRVLLECFQPNQNAVLYHQIGRVFIITVRALISSLLLQQNSKLLFSSNGSSHCPHLVSGSFMREMIMPLTPPLYRFEIRLVLSEFSGYNVFMRIFQRFVRNFLQGSPGNKPADYIPFNLSINQRT